MRKLIIGILLSFTFIFVFSSQAQSATVITLTESDTLGQYLVDDAGQTFYIFSNDNPNTSNCSGDCLGAWPPVTVDSTDADIIADGIAGGFGVIEREDTGEFQITYNRFPLYYFANDAAAGETNGQGLGDVWFVARPQILALGSTDELGSFLTDPAGNTLYTFAVDENGVSNCSGDCLAAWPAYSVTTVDELFAGYGVVAQADLSAIERTDTGALQVTYQGQPLYYFANDAAVGETNGQGLGDVWFVSNPTVLQSTPLEGMGDILVGRDGTTLYTFTNDTEGVSTCTGFCAVAWPLLTVASELDLATLSDDMLASITLAEHPNGELQVVYNGQPLYYFFNDAAAGDTNGEGVRDVWFVATAMMSEASVEECRVSPSSNVNLRSGPGTGYNIAGALLATDNEVVIGQAIGAGGFVWWQIASGAWVRSDLVTTEGACESIPTVTAPSLPATAVPVQATTEPEQQSQPTQPVAPPPQTTEES